jgi:hypothetical protein
MAMSSKRSLQLKSARQIKNQGIATMHTIHFPNGGSENYTENPAQELIDRINDESDEGSSTITQPLPAREAYWGGYWMKKVKMLHEICSYHRTGFPGEKRTLART